MSSRLIFVGKMLGCSLVNPIVFIVILWVMSMGGFFETVSANAIKLRISSVLIYITIAFFIFMVLTTIVFLLVKLNWPRLYSSRFFYAVFRAHKAFTGYSIFTLTAFTGLEGNVAGFFLIPLFILMSLVCFPISLRTFIQSITSGRQVEVTKPIRDLGVLLLGLLLLGGVSLWQQFPLTYFTNKSIEVRSDTPQYTIKQIVRAINTRDSTLFLEYVDLDTILVQVNGKYSTIKPEQIKQLMVQDILSGKSKIDYQTGGPVAIFEDWVVGGLQDTPQKNNIFQQFIIKNDLGNIETRNGEVYININVINVVGGDKYVLSFKMKKINGQYKVISCENINECLQNFEANKMHAAQYAKMVDGAKISSKSTVELNVKGIDADIGNDLTSNDISTFLKVASSKGQVQLNLEATIKNLSNQDIKSIGIFGYVRNKETGSIVGLHGDATFTLPKSIEITPLKPGEMREITISEPFTEFIIAYNIVKGKYQLIVAPEYIRFVDNSLVKYNPDMVMKP